MRNRRVKFRENINKQEVRTDKKLTIEDILAADLSHDGIMFMLFVLILLVGSIFFEEEALWIMALVLFVELISKRKDNTATDKRDSVV